MSQRQAQNAAPTRRSARVHAVDAASSSPDARAALTSRWTKAGHWAQLSHHPKMGNASSNKGDKQLYMAAMSNVTQMERKELGMVRQSFGDCCNLGEYNVTRDQLSDACVAANIMPQDVEILERMFTMFDKMGAAAIDYREFLAGLAPLVRGDVKARVLFACEVFDVADSGTLKKHELALVVNAMNNVASWFGDPAVTPEEVDALCENVFLESKDGVVIVYGEVVHQLVEDPAFRTFLAGQGSVHYG